MKTVWTGLRVVDDALVVNESPFILAFGVRMPNDKGTICCLVGGTARALKNSIKKDDLVNVQGGFMPGSRVGLDIKEILACENLLISDQAKVGRNINRYA